MTRTALIVTAMVLLLGAPTRAQNPIPPQLPTASLSLADARIIIDAAVAYARDAAKRPAAVVVLDNAGHLVSADRMDGAGFYLEKFARGKAFLSVITRRSTEEGGELAKSRPDRYFGIMAMYPGEIYAVGGGLPITIDGQLAGAVGVAGLPQGVDEKAARSGLEALDIKRKR